MGRSKNRHPLYERLEITDVAAEGKAITRKDDLVIFVPNCVPGDVVDVRISTKKKKYAEGTAVHFHAYSDLRIPAFCSHYGVCGGCKWQALPYSKQLEYKHQQVIDQLTRIGHLEIGDIRPILGSKDTTHYRNKLEYTFSALRWLSKDEMTEGAEADMQALGFHVPGMFDRIVQVETCYLQPEPSNSIRNFIYKLAKEWNLSFYNQRTHEGFLKNLIIRTASTGETMVILIVSNNQIDLIHSMLEALRTEFPQLASIQYVINPKKNDTIHDLEVNCFYGQPYIMESMENLQFRVGPKSFYQTNSHQAYELYKIVREFAGLSGKETVYDLYTGTGTIALFLAANAKQVIGIEYVPEAIEDAKLNAHLNKLEQTHFYAGDIKNVLPFMLEQHDAPDVIITDPPRAGMHPDVIESMLKLSPDKIVYVSCNPATQARDLALLSGAYQIAAIQPVDMFPHTHHVENVALLIKIK